MSILAKYTEKAVKKRIGADLICGVLLVLFLYTSVSKLLDFGNFRYVLSESSYLKPVAPVLAWLLPAVEILVAVFLFLPAKRIAGLCLSGILLGLFSFYLIFMVAQKSHLPCSCGGIIEFMSWRDHIILNLFLICLSAIGIWLYRKASEKIGRAPP